MAVEVVGWRSWFTNNPDGPGFRVFTSGDDEARAWSELPADGHQGTVLYVQHNDDRITRQLLDGYIFIFRWLGPDGVVFGVSNESREKIEMRYPGAILKQGRSITLDVFDQISREMMQAREPCSRCGG